MGTSTPPGASGEPQRLPEPAATPPPARAEDGAVTTASTDLIPSVTRLDRAIKDRRDTDIQLVNWWLYFLLLSWVTFGIYSIYLFFKRISRIEGFSRRKLAYYEAVLEWTQRQAAMRGQEDAIHEDLVDLGEQVRNAYKTDLRPINAGLSFVLTLITLGIYYFYVLYRMNPYWWDAQVLEQDFDDSLSQIWTRLGIVKYPLNYRADRSKDRSYPLYLILSIVTLGIWALVWDYKIHTDPDNLFGEFHSVEDTVLQTVRSQ